MCFKDCFDSDLGEANNEVKNNIFFCSFFSYIKIRKPFKLRRSIHHNSGRHFHDVSCVLYGISAEALELCGGRAI